MAILSESLRRDEVDSLFVGEPFLDQSFASIHHDAEHIRTAGAAQGIPSHSYTEVGGPPGSGKTAIWLGLILEALKRGLNVLYVTCNFTPFPTSRARALPGWNSERYEPRIRELSISSMKQYLLLDSIVDVADYGVVVIDHYEVLVKLSWDKDTRCRAFEALLQKASKLAQKSCILATTGCVKYQNEENCPLLAPSTIGARSRPFNMVRVMLYKDIEGNCVLSTGVKFRVAANGIQTAKNALAAAAVPLHGLATKRRPTPERLGQLHLLTPSSLAKKRRASVSTPVKAQRLLERSPHHALTHNALSQNKLGDEGCGLSKRQVSPHTTYTRVATHDDERATRVGETASLCVAGSRKST